LAYVELVRKVSQKLLEETVIAEIRNLCTVRDEIIKDGLLSQIRSIYIRIEIKTAFSTPAYFTILSRYSSREIEGAAREWNLVRLDCVMGILSLCEISLRSISQIILFK
jgi:hypothetical protein